MKNPFRTVLHRSAQDFDEILFSAGKIGYQVEMRPEDLKKVVPFLYADVIVDALTAFLLDFWHTNRGKPMREADAMRLWCSTATASSTVRFTG